ncbi:MAG: ATP phosphoribosyltransferase regulatory subunit [Oscillospiraceae bacterium]|nr:ATP phosphoribosyltransferase regulatory subunit [Oscillospiraceae bacterium]
MNQQQKKEELVTSRLQAMFEGRGFSRVRVNPFEEYRLYADNLNFLGSRQLITFTDMDGRLMALKPDVTLSIVRNMPPGELKRFEKLYYIDRVCRAADGEYKMLRQMGVELIGPQDDFVNLEIADLALSCLGAVSDDYVLDISHLGFVSGLLDSAPLNIGAKQKLMGALYSKSPHMVESILDEAGVNGDMKRKFTVLTSLSGPILELLPQVKTLVSSPDMQDGWQELDALGKLLAASGSADRVNLDFSAVNDLDYYNGMIFNGYVKGVPNAVLSGGRYDLLMRKMGKKSGAIGFAVYLSELNTYFKSGRGYDFDILLTYKPDCDYAALLELAKGLAANGQSVRIERGGTDTRLTCQKHMCFGESGLEGEGKC